MRVVILAIFSKWPAAAAKEKQQFNVHNPYSTAKKVNIKSLKKTPLIQHLSCKKWSPHGLIKTQSKTDWTIGL